MSALSATPPSSERIRTVLFDTDGPDRRLSLQQLDRSAIGDRQLLWVDLCTDDAASVAEVCDRLGLDNAVRDRLACTNASPSLDVAGPTFTVQAVAVEHLGQLEFHGVPLNLAVGHNIVVSLHPRPLGFIDDLLARKAHENDIGALSAESFTAALLDWHLFTYFDAVSDFEVAVERLEVGILSGSHRHRLAELHQLRKGASRLRRMLAPHRRVFSGLARPDFRPRQDGAANVHLQALDTRYERAMDMVENARDLVVGSFELFTSQTAWRTNRTMRALTFFTVLLGFLAVVAGVFGMNFEIALFRDSPQGFWITVGAMLLLVAVASAIGRIRHWL